MKLKDKFLNDFLGSDLISTKDILEWYKENKKSNDEYTYHSTIYPLLINPLLSKGFLEKINKGFYKLTNIAEFTTINSPSEVKEQKDEIDNYLEQQLLKK
jgi:hypothetical protein